ncbi:MAG: DNA/RNA non-specific endonuclease [Rikenellaceae bacterium]
MAKKRKNGSKDYYLVALLLAILVVCALYLLPQFLGDTSQEKQLQRAGNKIEKVGENAAKKVEKALDKGKETGQDLAKKAGDIAEKIKDSYDSKINSSKESENNNSESKSSKSTTTTTAKQVVVGGRLELPTISDSTYLTYNSDARYYIQFLPEEKIPLFVAYVLTRDEAKISLVERAKSFKEDIRYERLGAPTAKDKDYTRSGYDRGHMLPSADRNDSRAENDATFLFSNITPQTPSLNRGTLNQLEQQVREWAVKYDSLHIVTGSILRDNSNRPISRIGNGVAIPQYIYKAIAMKHDGEYKTVAFLMPNITGADSDFMEYITTVDEVEKLLDYDLFHALDDSIENSCEAQIDRKVFKRF